MNFIVAAAVKSLNAVYAPIQSSSKKAVPRKVNAVVDYFEESDTPTEDLSVDDNSIEAERNEEFLKNYFHQQRIRMEAIYATTLKQKRNSKFRYTDCEKLHSKESYRNDPFATDKSLKEKKDFLVNITLD